MIHLFIGLSHVRRHKRHNSEKPFTKQFWVKRQSAPHPTPNLFRMTLRLTVKQASPPQRGWEGEHHCNMHRENEKDRQTGEAEKERETGVRNAQSTREAEKNSGTCSWSRSFQSLFSVNGTQPLFHEQEHWPQLMNPFLLDASKWEASISDLLEIKCNAPSLRRHTHKKRETVTQQRHLTQQHQRCGPWRGAQWCGRHRCAPRNCLQSGSASGWVDWPPRLRGAAATASTHTHACTHTRTRTHRDSTYMYDFAVGLPLPAKIKVAVTICLRLSSMLWNGSLVDENWLTRTYFSTCLHIWGMQFLKSSVIPGLVQIYRYAVLKT